MLPKIRTPEHRTMITVEVLANTATSPNFATLTLGGPELEHLDHGGHDQAVRLFFPREGQDRLRMPTSSGNAWMAELLLLPKTRRPWVRNYTIRRRRPERGEVDVEFALHDDAPAADWARRARPGDPAGIFDIGVSYLPPDDARHQLLVGDESAVPAILAILEHAPDDLRADVVLEVPETADIRSDVTAPPGARVRWVARDGSGDVPGVLALAAAKEWSPGPGRGYAWVAGESKLATGLRRHLVQEHGMPKQDIAFFGYWRHGRSSPG
ncbi:MULTISPECIES: siderophore-interacting protein [unclassified Saccharopolyspora]|uniref:siderophore-interacting protein n=1 Tax=unclassified Saccharopolyspora TaxID=2646250 RepID=UPI001CD1FCC0|nr:MULTISPECIES: siderophore-interacting protein [unclassified Saccharopolyspora]MCA1188255.1 siderophore-interacting protein [Saccharopolyspora sp. 6T]MCA1225625.1 siderophore-interacting protein [Saccharopolyspora sp. 6M]MCA1281514.1 siderophore-interacting protein [Saccharopolyspora sp. 7B]